MAEEVNEIPSGRCGHNFLDNLTRKDLKDGELISPKPTCCWRPVWNINNETDRCIWHADTEEKPLTELIKARADIPETINQAILHDLNGEGRTLSFNGCTLQSTTFKKSDLRGCDFTNADLRNANFSDADLPKADFTDANLLKTDFTDANLPGADFTDTNLFFADFTGANLLNAKFIRTDCRATVFTDAYLDGAVLADVRVSSQTTFYDPTRTRPYCIHEKDPELYGNRVVASLKAAQRIYRRLESLHEANALSDEARMFHISKEEVERKLRKKQHRVGSWGVKTLMWWFTKHGESVGRVLFWWAFVISTAGFLFAFSDGVRDGSGNEYVLTSIHELGTVAGINDLLMNLYFSMTTFSTIMDGGLAPAGTSTRAIVAVESITGALLVALLVFVLGRQTAR